VFLIGDSDNEELRKEFIGKSQKATLLMIAAGGLVFVASIIENVDFAFDFISNPFSIGLIAAATVVLPILWMVIKRGKKWSSRIITGAQLLFIISAFYAVYFPKIVVFKDAEDLTLFNSAAPDITVSLLAWALMLGSLLIFPALIYLLRVFKHLEDKNGWTSTPS